MPRRATVRKTVRVPTVITKRSPVITKPPPSSCCTGGVCDPQIYPGLKVGPTSGAQIAKGRYVLSSVEGPGLFVCGVVKKQGGATGLTGVNLTIDGRRVIGGTNFVAMVNTGLTRVNPFGEVVLAGSGVQSYTFGWPVPLVFKKNVTLEVSINEVGVIQIVSSMLVGSCP